MPRSLAALLLTGLAACATDPGDGAEPTYGEGLGTPADPIPHDGVTYAVRTTIELPLATTSPEVATASANLRAFAQSPAKTLIAVAKSGGVTELAQLMSALPSSLSTRLEGWLDTELDKLRIGTRTVRQLAVDLAGFTETSLTRFGLDSTLTFSPAKTIHTLGGVTFRLAGFEVVVPLGGLKADSIGQAPAVTVGTGGSITFGDHEFGFAFGDHAWHGINLASEAAIGATVETALVTAIDCRALAQAIATKCYSGACVGHAPQLEAVCAGALDLVASTLAEHVLAFQLDGLQHLSGSARLVDDNGDGLANRIDGGVWTSSSSVGPTHGVFTATAPGR